MLTIDQGGDGLDGSEERSVVLLPAGTRDQGRPHVLRAARPDAGFVTHLIATAEQLPQTRTLRRAAPADVHSAYAARLQPVKQAGGRTRQVA
ncbi:hypothetical protein SSBR45G_29280 [Bradyrhizobium sp. SSBR45G]|uniref:hypothetical protein n=1 Tax=unclassified Bradyrhizobium TaxID=2631580 RepID=UPI002342AEC9|nr:MULTISPECIES: hypothetical protein [unclassified Bradyrhizobium]GLH78020.1 hypothetical protein SSBR45G_29280 [Bradyrhizobium sp. SSBR45G]GLH88665.1 hypothetical protein SSBR45R_61260 [Bradyrhizobium sp. SSBR45R]